MAAFPNAAHCAISSDNSAALAQARALAASAELRAERESINLEIERLRLRALDITHRINAVELTARQGN